MPSKDQNTVEINILKQPIDYSFAFFDHIKNYKILEENADGKITEDDVLEVLGKTIKPVLFCNIHTEMPLNVTSKFDPTMRTLAWANPLEYAIKAFDHLGSSHDYSALLREWTKGKVRDNITFVIVPPGKSMAFCIGVAERQTGTAETRLGNGVQVRFNHLPEDTIALTLPLHPDEDPEEDEPIDIIARLQRCVEVMREEQASDPEKFMAQGINLVDWAKEQGDFFGSGQTIHHKRHARNVHGFALLDYVFDNLDEKDTTLLEITPKRVENARKLLQIMTSMAAVKIQSGWRKAKKQVDLEAVHKTLTRTNTDTLKRAKKNAVVHDEINA